MVYVIEVFIHDANLSSDVDIFFYLLDILTGFHFKFGTIGDLLNLLNAKKKSFLLTYGGKKKVHDFCHVIMVGNDISVKFFFSHASNTCCSQ